MQCMHLHSAVYSVMAPGTCEMSFLRHAVSAFAPCTEDNVSLYIVHGVHSSSTIKQFMQSRSSNMSRSAPGSGIQSVSSNCC